MFTSSDWEETYSHSLKNEVDIRPIVGINSYTVRTTEYHVIYLYIWLLEKHMYIRLFIAFNF